MFNVQITALHFSSRLGFRKSNKGLKTLPNIPVMLLTKRASSDGSSSRRMTMIEVLLAHVTKKNELMKIGSSSGECCCFLWPHILNASHPYKKPRAPTACLLRAKQKSRQRVFLLWCSYSLSLSFSLFLSPSYMSSLSPSVDIMKGEYYGSDGDAFLLLEVGNQSALKRNSQEEEE